jgi:CubicO group peptidase (beta-lactamase class C family)
MALVTGLTARRLEAALATEQRQGRVPSVAAALTRDGSLVWQGSCGQATGVADGRPVELQYRIGSLTKTMTAVLLLQLREEGRLGLSDPLSAYLPEVGTDVTLRSLLSHSSGVAAEPVGDWWERVAGGSFAQLAAGLGRSRPPFEPGATYHYSNVAFGLLGEVVARVGDRPWRECLSERVLVPLGMLRTTYDPSAPHARGYSVSPYAPVLTEEPAVDTGAMAPAGQVWSTVRDLAAYADFLVAGHRDVLSASTLREMATPQSGTAAEGLSRGYGLGLRLMAGGSGTLVGHTGSMPGFQAALFVDRPRRTGAVVLANSTSGLRTERVASALLDVLEELEPTVPDAWAPVEGVPRAVQELLGVWHWGNTGRLFTWDGELLSVVHLLGGDREELFRLTGDGFVGVGGHHDGEPLDVVRRPEGTVSHLNLSTFVLTRTPYDPAAPIPGGRRSRRPAALLQPRKTRRTTEAGAWAGPRTATVTA